MQTLYAAQFDVATGADDAVAIRTRLAEHVADWVTRGVPSLSSLSVEQLIGPPGQAELASRFGRRRIVRWESAEAEGISATRIRQTEPRDDSDDAIFTSLTLGATGRRSGSFRIQIGLITPAGRLLPVSTPNMRQPLIVASLLSDPLLTCRVGSQLVDGRYVMIGNESEAHQLADSLLETARLPLIVVNTSWHEVWLQRQDGVRDLTQQLAGLARVAALSYWRGANALGRRIPQLTPAVDTGVLVWPDRSQTSLPFALVDLDNEAAALTRAVSQAAVTSYGRDEAWNSARRAAALAAASDRDNAIAAARAQGDTSALVAALESKLAAAELDAQSSQELIDELDADNTELTAEKNELRAQLNKLKGKFAGMHRTAPVVLDSIQLIAELRDSPNLTVEDVMSELPIRTNGAIAFSDNAGRAWADAAYPDPLRMAAHLCDLANAALQWAASGGVVGGNVHEWLLGYGLNNSTLDDSLQQLKLSTFQYENHIYDRTPHIKVDDYKHPGQVGRIYFAIANDPARFIVDHVGQKLYLREGKRLRKAR